MKRPTLAGLVCIGLLIGLELSYRRFEVPPDVVVPSLAANQPLVFLLGSSRTRAGARPLVIEEELGLNGVPDAWVASVCHDAVTLVGLRHVWRERVAPLLVDSAGAVRGVVAIAVRLSALNDSHLESGELAWLPPDERLVSATHQASFAEHTSVAMHQRVHLFAGRRALLDAWQRHRRTRERQARLRDWTTEGAPNLRRVLDAEDFGQGERGWRPFEGPAPGDLDRKMWGDRYEDLLEGFSHGGVQTDALRSLVEEVKSQGLVPVLFTMPVSQAHLDFYPDDLLRELGQHLDDVAFEAGIDYLDLGRDSDLPPECFFDTHHLRAEAVDVFSRQFTHEVLLPVLE